MTHTIFAREGWITFGNPNHYRCDDLMLRELRARARDTDSEAQYAAEALKDLERGFEEENGQKLTEKNAGIFGCGISDEVADYLSDMSPEGYVFEIRRTDRGYCNYGYFRKDPLTNNEWITWEEFKARTQKEYGDAGIYAAESGLVSTDDLCYGYDHCLDLILPGLEEELIAEGELDV